MFAVFARWQFTFRYGVCNQVMLGLRATECMHEDVRGSWAEDESLERVAWCGAGGL